MVDIMDIKQGFRETEIGIIPSDWLLRSLSEVSFMKGRIGWQGLKQSEFTMNPDDPFLITGMNFKDGEIRWNEVYHVAEDRFQLAKDIQLKKGDVLLTKDGTIGKLLFVSNIPYPGKATLNSHLLVFRPIKKNYDPLYLYFNLSSPFFKNHIELVKSGTTFFGISQESVSKYQIPLPPTLAEQTAIATVLKDADALITQLEKLIAKKRAIKQGAMQELLTGKTRLDGFEQKLGLKQTDVGKIPADWKVYQVKDLIELLTDYDANGSFASVAENVKVYDHEEYAWYVRSTDLEKNSKLSEVRYIDKSSYKFLKKTTLFGGELLFLKRGDIGNVYLFKMRTPMATVAPNLYLLKLNDISNSSYLFYYFKSSIGQLQLKSKNASSTLGALYKDDVKSILVPLPPTLAEQNAIAKTLSDMDTEIEGLENKLEKYKKIKLGMMQELLTGRIRLV